MANDMNNQNKRTSTVGYNNKLSFHLPKQGQQT